MRHGNFQVDHIPFARFAFADEYQRSVIPARVRHLKEEWRLEDVGAVTGSVRDGNIWAVDGQHRIRAAMELGLGNTKVLTHLYRNLTVEDEARKFLTLNDARTVDPFSRFKAGIAAADPACLNVQALLAKHGLEIGKGGDGYVRCVTKVLALHDKDPKLLDQVCGVLVEAWGLRATAFEQVVFTAMGMMLSRYNGELDQSAFVKKMAGYRGGPAALAGDARGLADFRPLTVTRAAAEIMRDTYNKGRRSGQLSPL